MTCSKQISFISFAEIVKNSAATVRVTHDNFIYAVDFAQVVTRKSRNYATQILLRLPENIFHPSKFLLRRTSQHGGHMTKLISLEDALELVMVLPGNIAKQIRKHFKEIIVRYLNGDRSMCQEIEANHEAETIQNFSDFASKIMNNVDNCMEDSNQGFIYATQTPAFPGLIKIGKTSDVQKRLLQLNTACAPAPHVIIAVTPTLNKDRDEKAVHAFFADARRAGEFFEIRPQQVIDYFTMFIDVQYKTELAAFDAGSV